MCTVLCILVENTFWYFSGTPQLYFYDKKGELIVQEFDMGSIADCPILI